MYYLYAAHFLFAYFHSSPQCMHAPIAPHQSCQAAANGTVCTLGFSPSSPFSLLRSLLGPATLVMRAEYTIRACHTLTAGAAPLPRLDYRLKHLLINTDLPLLPLSTHTRMHAHTHLLPLAFIGLHSANKWWCVTKVPPPFSKRPSIMFFSFCIAREYRRVVFNTAYTFIEQCR